MSLLDRMIFRPARGARVRTEELDFPCESVRLVADDGTGLHAYFVPAPERRASLLFLHANRGEASMRLPRARALAELGLDVLVLDYRGYGLSDPVPPNEAGAQSDVRAAHEHLVKERGVPAHELLVYGRSLGGALAVDLAARERIAGLVLESTFTSVADISQSYWGVPLRFWLGKKLSSIDKIRSVAAPILFFHGSRDRVIRPAIGLRLFEAANEPKSWQIIEGAHHGNLSKVGGRAYLERWGRFVDEVVSGA